MAFAKSTALAPKRHTVLYHRRMRDNDDVVSCRKEVNGKTLQGHSHDQGKTCHTDHDDAIDCTTKDGKAGHRHPGERESVCHPNDDEESQNS